VQHARSAVIEQTPCQNLTYVKKLMKNVFIVS